MATQAQERMADLAADMMFDGFIRKVRLALKERVLAAIDGEVDAAVEEALQALKPRLESARNYAMDQIVVNLLVKRGESGEYQKITNIGSERS